MGVNSGITFLINVCKCKLHHFIHGFPQIVHMDYYNKIKDYKALPTCVYYVCLV
jgi:hypothetical protein